MGVSETTDEERLVIRECIKEAFWYRSLPLGVVTCIGVQLGVKSGKIPSTKYGAWPIVVGAGSCAYVLGKLSYIFGDNCSRKFLERAPNSEITAHLRLNNDQKPLLGDVVKKSNSWPSLEERNLGFADILEGFDFSRISDVEKSIMNDCNSTAFWKYSLPMAVIISGAIYSAIKAGLLNSSKRVTTFPRLPKMLIGGSLGYIAGQWLYVYSRDCTNRFINFAPEGEIARRLRGDLVEHVCRDCMEEEEDEYVIPVEGGEVVEKIIKEQLGL